MNGHEREAPASKAPCPACGSIETTMRGTDDGYLCVRECERCHRVYSDRLTGMEMSEERLARTYKRVKNGVRR